jgi:hypothetical protein
MRDQRFSELHVVGDDSRMQGRAVHEAGLADQTRVLGELDGKRSLALGGVSDGGELHQWGSAIGIFQAALVRQQQARCGRLAVLTGVTARRAVEFVLSAGKIWQECLDNFRKPERCGYSERGIVVLQVGRRW